MSKRTCVDYIKDIISELERIERFVGNMSYEEFINNEKTIKRRVPEPKPINEVNTNLILNRVRPAEKGQCCLSLNKGEQRR